MPGITKVLEGVRKDFARFQERSRVRTGDLQKQIDELTARVDKLDKPAQTQTGPPSKRAKSSSKKKSSKKAAARKPKLTPVPDRPDLMKDAGVGKDPR